jgi:hypothetical protein
VKNSKAILALSMFFISSNLSHPAYAYLDPGSGSMLLQLLLGGVAGIAMVFKLYWERIRSVFSRGNTDSKTAVSKESEK